MGVCGSKIRWSVPQCFFAGWVGKNRMTTSEEVLLRLGFALDVANHRMFLSNQMVKAPWAFNAALYVF